VPPPGLADVTADPRPAAAGQLTAVVAAGAARRVWREQARLGLALLERRLERRGPTATGSPDADADAAREAILPCGCCKAC
jgi:hypothetical protein